MRRSARWLLLLGIWASGCTLDVRGYQDPTGDAGEGMDADRPDAGADAGPMLDAGADAGPPTPDAGPPDAGPPLECDTTTCPAPGVCNGNICVLDCTSGACPAVVCPPGLPCEVICDATCTSIDCSAARSCDIDCDGTNYCQGEITCSGESCTLTCGRDACDGPVTCTADTCNLGCTAVGACVGGVSCDTSDVGDCTIDCDGDFSCRNDVTCNAASCFVNCDRGACTGDLSCTAPGGCQLRCDQPDGCTGTVTCDADTCMIDCTGDRTCLGALSCTSVGDCNLHCDRDSCTSSVECTSMTFCDVWCHEPSSCRGTVASSAPTNTVRCEGLFSCGDVSCAGAQCSIDCRREACDAVSCLGVTDCDVLCDEFGSCDGLISCTGTQCVRCASGACSGGTAASCTPDVGMCP